MFQKIFTINNIKKPGLKGVVIFFSVDFNPTDIKDILDIHIFNEKNMIWNNVWVN